MNENILRIAFMSMGINVFASALLTSIILMMGTRTPVELFCISSLWITSVAFSTVIAWATRALAARPGQSMKESFLRSSFLAVGLFFFTCALSSTLAFSSAYARPEMWFCIGGLWISFAVFASIALFSGTPRPVVDATAETGIADSSDGLIRKS